MLVYLILHQLHQPQRLPPRPDAQSLVGLILIVLGIVLVSKNSEFPGYWALLPTMGACLVIAAGPGAWLNRALFESASDGMDRLD